MKNDASSFERARNETISYHKLYYNKHKLFDETSWLAKPDAGLMKLVDELVARSEKDGAVEPLTLLDLGCGVGRNAIPVAMLLAKFNVNAKLVCVDLLDDSIEMLKENSTKYGVDHIVEGVVADNDHFQIENKKYDLIAAISVVEHCAGRAKALKLLKSIAAGLKPEGLVRIEMTTDRNVIDLGSKQAVPTHVETPLTENEVRSMLADAFSGCKTIELEVFPYREELDKDNKRILWQSKQVSFAARATGK